MSVRSPGDPALSRSGPFRERGGLAGDRGVATVWAATAVAVLMAITVFGIDLGAAASARHRVEAAADLAALAAAAHAVEGESAACAYGASVLESMSARLVRCRLLGWEVFIEVTAPVRVPPLPAGSAAARSRAGPVG